jgi:hypothetical protein
MTDNPRHSAAARKQATAVQTTRRFTLRLGVSMPFSGGEVLGDEGDSLHPLEALEGAGVLVDLGR